MHTYALFNGGIDWETGSGPIEDCASPAPDSNPIVAGIGGYRYGFNGMEEDYEIYGTGNSYTTHFRQYDPRLGRWKSIDPLTTEFPWQSPYVAFDNNPVLFSDLTGASADSTITQNSVDTNFNPATGGVTVSGVLELRTQIFKDNEDGSRSLVSTVIETVRTTIEVSPSGEIENAITTTKFTGWDDLNGSYDLSFNNHQSNNKTDALPNVWGIASAEARFIKKNGLSSHARYAELAKARNNQNDVEFFYLLPARMIEMATGNLLTGLIGAGQVVGDATTSPNQYFGMGDENPSYYNQHIDFLNNEITIKK
jgi:RHS repeat-associated protein